MTVFAELETFSKFGICGVYLERTSTRRSALAKLNVGCANHNTTQSVLGLIAQPTRMISSLGDGL